MKLAASCAVSAALVLGACSSTDTASDEAPAARLTPTSGFAAGSLGGRLYYEVHGAPDGPDLFLLGVSPSLEQSVAEREGYLALLGDRYRILLADYPGGIGRSEAPGDPRALTVERFTQDMLALADAVGMERFAIAGYSWGGNAALQVATRSERVTALIVGGWPALGGPYDQSREMCTRIAAASAGTPAQPGMTMEPGDYWQQFIAYYSSLADWDERAAVQALTCPRLNFVDAADSFELMGLASDLAGATRASEDELRALGWEVVYVESGAGHMGGFAVEVAGPVIEAFLDRHVLEGWVPR